MAVRRDHDVVRSGLTHDPYQVAEARQNERTTLIDIDIKRDDIAYRTASLYLDAERSALDAEIGRLQSDNEKLKAQLAAREPTVTGKIDEPLEHVRRPEMKNIQVPLDVYRVVLPWTQGKHAGRQYVSSRLGARVGVIAVLIGVVAMLLLWWPTRLPHVPSAPSSDVVAPPTKKSVGVLPFVNMSSDKENEYFSDGITEDLITALSKVSGLHVAARTSSFAFKGKNEDIHTIGTQLHVGAVLEGSVAKAGKELRSKSHSFDLSPAASSRR